MIHDELISVFGLPIATYARHEAIADGILIDVTAAANESGFKIPVAVTHAVWDRYIAWTNKDSQKQMIQDQNGRLWDVLVMLRFAIAKTLNAASIFYKLNIVPRDGKSKKTKLVKLKAILGAGDNGEAVITI